MPYSPELARARRLVPLLAAALVLGLLATFSAGSADALSEPPLSPEAPVWRTLDERARADGRVDVVVRLRAGWASADQRSASAVEAATAAVTERLRGTRHEVVHRFESFPLVALRLSPAAVSALQGSGLAASVGIDDPLERSADATLEDTTRMVGADKAWESGVDGSGYAVAVIDTGVDATHAMLDGKIIGEACFSVEGSCPGGTTAEQGPGTGRPCAASIDGCEHGTHVAAIAAGTKGVARGAKVVSIAAYSVVTDPAQCAGGPAPCVNTRPSDVLKALEWLATYTPPGASRLAAVNISMGAGMFTSTCDSATSQNTNFKEAIDTLKSRGIATVAAAGNQRQKMGMRSPACLSNVVSVGNVDTGDIVAETSNSLPELDLLAPGTGVVSAVPAGTPGASTGSDGPVMRLSGTSQATPHVAGAFALAAHARGQEGQDRDPDAVERVLKLTGKPVTDPKNGFTTPRLRIYDALTTDVRAHPAYELVDLGTLAGDASAAHGINDKGQVVGTYEPPGSNTSRPFLWSDGELRLLRGKEPTPPWHKNGGGTAYSVNESGQAVGDSLRNRAGLTPLAYRTTAIAWPDPEAPGTPIDVHDADGQVIDCEHHEDDKDDENDCTGRDVNEAGTVVGGAGANNPFVRDPDQPAGVLLPPLGFGSPSGRAEAVNTDGVIAGHVRTASGLSVAVLWKRRGGGYATDDLQIPFEVGTQSKALDVNDDGVAVGSVSSPGGSQAFRADRPRALGMLPGFEEDRAHVLQCCSEANAINDGGEIVGWARKSAGTKRAALWTNRGIVDLNETIEEPAWQLEEATDVNDRGEIVGYGLRGGKKHAFLLRPPDPVVFLPGIGGSSLEASSGKQWFDCHVDPLRLSLFPADAPDQSIAAHDVLRKEECKFLPLLPAAKIDVYGTFLETLAASGYREYRSAGKPFFRTEQGCDLGQRANRPNLFLLPYDWRRPLSASAERLSDLLACVKKLYADRPGPLRVNLLAHSMGGLVARRYLLDHPTTPGTGPAPEIARLVTLGTPWLGSPKANLTLETGDFAGPPSPRLAHAASSFAPVGALLPSRWLYHAGRAPLQEDGWDLNRNGVRHERYRHQDAVPVLDDRYPLPRSFTAGRTYPPGQLGTIGAGFHDRAGQDDWRSDPPAEAATAVDVFHFHGISGRDTIASLRAQLMTRCTGTFIRSCHESGYLAPTFGEGDGTVPTESATRMLGGDDPVDLNSPTARVMECRRGKADHVGMMANPEIIADVVRALRHRSPEPYEAACTIVRDQDPAASEDLDERRLLDGEPRDAVEPDGWRVTVAGATGVAVEDGAGHSTAIPRGAPQGVQTAALGAGVVEATLPQPEAAQEYTLRLTTTDEPLTVELRRGTAGALDRATRYRDVELPASRAAMLRIDSTGAKALTYAGDGGGEHTVPATASASGAAAGDTTAPQVTLCRSASKYALRALDAGSGVKDLWWSTDGETFSPYEAPLDLDPASTPAVTALSDDQLSNRSATRLPLADAATVSRISVGDSETDEDEGTIAFKVTLDCPSDVPVTVNYGTDDDDADGAADYDAVAGSVTFAPGQTDRTVAVVIHEDELDEDDESFRLLLGGPANASLDDGAARGTITDDDEAPAISIADVSVTEADTSAVSAKLTLELSAPSGRAVTVGWATVDGTAKAGSDYVAASGTVTFPAGVTTREIETTVVSNTGAEDEERFTVELSDPSHATLADGEAAVTVTDDDGAPTLGACHAPTITFDAGAGTGSWGTPANWTGDRLPGPDDVVCIPATAVEQVSVTGDVEIKRLETREKLSIAGGSSPFGSEQVHMRITDPAETTHLRADTTLGGFRVLHVAGVLAIEPGTTFTWTSTTHLTGNGDVTIAPGATFKVDGGRCGLPQSSFECRTLSGARLVRNEGTMLFSRGYLGVDQQVTIANTGTIEVGDDVLLGAGTADLRNLGTIRKLPGPGRSMVDADLRNLDRVVVDGGRLELRQHSDERQPGTFTVAAGATLDLSGDTWHLDAPSPIVGDGTFVAGGGGTINVNGVNAVASTRLLGAVLRLNHDAALSNLTIDNGTLGGSGTLTVPAGQTLGWDGGTMAGTGTTIIESGAAVELRGPSMALAEARTVINRGTATMSGARLLATGGVITNAGTFLVPRDAAIAGTADFRFTNTGTFRKTAGTGTLELTGNLQNAGAMRVQTGWLRASMRGTPPAQSGTVNISSGASLELRDGDFPFVPGAAVTGKGHLLVDNGSTVTAPGVFSVGSVQLSGAGLVFPADVTIADLRVTAGALRGPGDVTIPAGGKLALSGGQIAGSGTLTIQDGAALGWAGGVMAGTGTTRIAAGATATVTARGDLGETRTLVNAGTMTVAPDVTIWATGGQLHNTGTLTLGDAASIERQWGEFTIRDSGLIRKLGTRQSRLSGDLQLDGTLDVTAGSLRLHTNAGPRVATANATVAAGAEVEIYTGSLDWTGGRLTGAGTLRVSNQPTVTLPADTSISVLDVAGQLHVPQPISAHQLTVSSGAVRGPGDITIPAGGKLALSGGQIAGSGTLTIQDGAALGWAGGVMAGTGTTRIAAGATATVTARGDLGETRTLVNAGTMTVAPDVTIWATGGQLHNTGTLTLGDAASIERQWGEFTIRDSGLIRKLGTRQSRLSGDLQLDGTLDVTAGSLRLHTNAGPRVATANATVAAGAEVEIYTGSLDWTGGRLTGAGTLRVSNQPTVTLPADTSISVLDVAGQLHVPQPISAHQLTVSSGAVRGPGDITIPAGGKLALSGGQIAGSGTLTIQDGAALGWAGGVMAGTGTTRIAAGATATVTARGDLGETRTLVNAGTMTVAPDVTIWATGGQLHNTGTLTLGDAASIERQWGEFTIRDSGLIRKLGTRQSRLSGDLQLDGTLDVTAGSLRLHTNAGPRVATANATVAAGAEVEIYTGSLDWTGGRLTGAGTLRVSNQPTVTLPADTSISVLDVAGQLHVPQPISAHQLTVSSGAVRGPGDITIPAGGKLALSGGQIAGSGTLTIQDGAALGWAGGVMAGTGTTRIAAGATATVTARGDLGETRTLVNAGTMTVAPDVTIWATGGQLHNTGTLTLGDAASISPVGAAAFPVTNAGLLRKTAGTGPATVGTTLHNTGRIAVDRGTLATGDLTNAPGARVELTIGGVTPGTQHAQLSIRRTATLDGTLALVLAPGFEPPPASAYAVLRYAGRAGAFATVESPADRPPFTVTYASDRANAIAP